MNIDSCYQLGYIIKPHGLNGDVSIFIDADEPEAYRNLESVFIEQDKVLIPFFVTKLKLSGQKAILKLEESTTIDDAAALKGSKLYLPLSSLPDLSDDQFYFHEIIGYSIIDEIAGDLGEVATVYDVGPQDLLAFHYKGEEILLPINDNTIRSVDKKERCLKVAVPDGLLDIYLSKNDDED